MKISITFRHVAATDAMKQHTQEKFARLQKYVQQPIDAQVVLALDRHLHVAEATVSAGSQMYQGREESNDMYVSIDHVVDKIERQISKAKGQLRARKKHGQSLDAALAGSEPVAALAEESEAPARASTSRAGRAKP